jgi:hypothetical protein
MKNADTYGFAERRKKKNNNNIKIKFRTLLDLYMEKNAAV